MGAPLIEYLGWLATAVFVGSYLCKGSASLKRVQMIGALMWVVYGLVIGATPVVAANLLVFSVAGWTLTQNRSKTGELGERVGEPSRALPIGCDS